MGTIYKITNLINQKIYIGKTIRDPRIRWQEHLQYSHQNSRYNTPLYQAIRKYGAENFMFEVIEENIDNEKLLNEKEKNYIEIYHSTSHDKGYNIALGGDGGRVSSKLSEIDAKDIQLILQDDNNLQSFNEIGELFNISGSVIRSINVGTSWYNSKLDYPLRKYNVIGLSLTRKQYADIVEDILTSNLLLSEIGIKYNISESRMTAINQGRECYKNHPYYQGIYTGSFPIRKDRRKQASAEDFVAVFYDVLFTSDSMAKIGAKYGIEGNTIQCIITGRRRKELTQNFILPMRKNLDENKKIFNTLYPDYERRDAQ